MPTNCFGTNWGDLEGLFLGSLLPLLEVVIPAAHVTMHVLFLRGEKSEQRFKLLSVFPAPTPPEIDSRQSAGAVGRGSRQEQSAGAVGRSGRQEQSAGAEQAAAGGRSS